MTPYTGRGDEGRTDLRTGERVSKADPRIEAYGAVDEVNALLGIIRADCADTDEFDERLGRLQQDLHTVQAELANPDPDDDAPRIDETRITALETWMDEYDAELEPLRSFVLPGGSELGARLHHARAVARRAERRVVELMAAEDVEAHVQTYLNRLSDLLFVLARVANARAGVPEESPTY